MPSSPMYKALVYCTAIFALAAATVFVFIVLANLLSFVLSLTENARLYDVITEYATRSNAFSHFLKQTVMVAAFYLVVHSIWRRLRKT